MSFFINNNGLIGDKLEASNVRIPALFSEADPLFST